MQIFYLTKADVKIELQILFEHVNNLVINAMFCYALLLVSPCIKLLLFVINMTLTIKNYNDLFYWIEKKDKIFQVFFCLICHKIKFPYDL